MARKKKEDTPIDEGFPQSIGPDESPELKKEGRPIMKLQAQIPEMNIRYADLVRVAMDRQGITQIQLGINDPYERESGYITDIIYLSPRGMGILLRMLITNYRKFLKISPELADELSMPQLRDLLE
jgi:hypothetical protein